MFAAPPEPEHGHQDGFEGHHHPKGSLNYQNFNPGSNLLPNYTASERRGAGAFFFVLLILICLVMLFGRLARSEGKVRRSGSR